jgi:Fe(3+) dicitrate transport protein
MAAGLVLANTAPAKSAETEAADIVVRGIIPEPVESVAGSLTVIDAKALARMQPITVKDVLRRAPGLHIVDEDAFGLKLNISVRGLNARRSGRTLLLEDGVPIQPAPYADPSAHYYPPLNRIEQIELRKGSAQILYGPQSIGGVVNFVTRPVPDGLALEGAAEVGARAFRSADATLGFGNDRAGIRIDAVHREGDGIRDFHATRVDEIAVKTRLLLGDRHTIMVKGAYYEEHSSLTEGGLDQARFNISPYYNPFRNDRFVLDRVSTQLVHDWSIADNATLSTQAYYARTFRASYRQADTSIDTMTANPATGCAGAARTDYERFAALCGNKMRPRVFAFWGIEPRLQIGWSAFGVTSETILGARVHVEDTNRKRYNGLTANARETSPGTLLRDDNDIGTHAYSAYLQNVFRVGALRVTPGVRVERIETVNRARFANFVAIDRTASSGQTLVLPGVGITWTPNDKLTAFIGVHKGFAPPRPDRDFNPTAPFNAVRPERSTETELGVRLRPRAGIAVDATLFEMDLSDLIVEGSLVGGRSGTFVNAGEARHRGFELAASADLDRLQLGLTYSYLFEAQFLTDVDEVTRGVRGNRIPYAPEHLVDAHVGYRHPGGFGAEFGINHVSEQFANASNTRIASSDGLTGTIPARTIARASVSYRVPRSRLRLFATVENVFDQAYIASRIDGLFAGPQRQVVVGIRFGR